MSTQKFPVYILSTQKQKTIDFVYEKYIAKFSYKLISKLLLHIEIENLFPNPIINVRVKRDDTSVTSIYE